MIATDTGAPLVGVTQSPRAFVDSFDRPDGPLGNGWINGHDFDPPSWEPLGIHNGSAVVLDPMTRGGTYETNTAYNPPLNGELHAGIGCAWREMGTDSVYVEVEWSGIHLFEASPCVHFTPGSDRMALGVWTSHFGPAGMLILADIGNPPEHFPFTMIAIGGFTRQDGVPRRVGIRTDGSAVTVWMDGAQVPLFPTDPEGDPIGLDPVPVPDELLGSTMHGVEFDTHFWMPRSEIPTTPVIHKISIRPV